jgi:hypothetical protein
MTKGFGAPFLLGRRELICQVVQFAMVAGPAQEGEYLRTFRLEVTRRSGERRPIAMAKPWE